MNDMVISELQPKKSVSNFETGVLIEKTGFSVGSLDNPGDIEKAVDLMVNGDVIAAQWGNVFGLWMDASNNQAVKKIIEAKGEKNKTRTFTSMLETGFFLGLIDRNRIPPEFAKLIRTSAYFKKRVGALCHFRVPVRQELVDRHSIPSSIVSVKDEVPYLQHLEPAGHPLMHRFIDNAGKKGVSFVAVTSLNDVSKDEKEITQTGRAIEFCQEKGISLLLTDPLFRAQDAMGSFSILEVSKEGLRAVRNGNVPTDVLEQIFEMQIVSTGVKEAKYSGSKYYNQFEKKYGHLSPELKRTVVILHNMGYGDKEIEGRVQKVRGGRRHISHIRTA